jgi:HSP90 family molecular chaperone
VVGEPYKMTIALNVLEHLGENLYSSTPAVLAEAVANAWDANARRVAIDVDKDAQRITITDDGDGMDLADVNNKFLMVGYHRRESGDNDAVTNRLGRHVMGRKGIGKLSLFAIAQTIDVHTVRVDPAGIEIDRHAFRLRC